MRKRNYSLVFLLCLQVCWLNMTPVDAQNRNSNRATDKSAVAAEQGGRRVAMVVELAEERLRHRVHAGRQGHKRHVVGC